MTMRAFVHHGKPVNLVSPRDVNGAAQGGNYGAVSLRNYQGAFIFIQVGAHSGNPVGISLKQAKSTDNSAIKALSFTEYYSNTVGASPTEESDLWQKKTASSDTFDVAANTNYLIPIRPGMFDVTNRFDCLRVDVEAGSASTILGIMLFLHDGPMGIADNTKHIPSARVNRMPYGVEA